MRASVSFTQSNPKVLGARVTETRAEDRATPGGPYQGFKETASSGRCELANEELLAQKLEKSWLCSVQPPLEWARASAMCFSKCLYLDAA